jgi:hypothetical protein
VPMASLSEPKLSTSRAALWSQSHE